MLENPSFLKEKYDLHTADEVDVAAKRTEQKTDEHVPQDPAARIQNYLDRLERLALDPAKKQSKKMFGSESRPRALLLLREMVMSKYVRPNKDKMAAGAARVEERAARTLGIEAQYGPDELDQRGDIAVVDLEKSLDNWITYLSDQNEPYPTWFRYYAFRNILDLGDYDKDKGEFTKRSQGSTRLFPDIDRGALAYVEQMIEAAKDPAMLERLQKAQRVAANGDVPVGELITQDKSEHFAKLSFAKQYAEGIKQAGEITPEMREETRGEWVKYQQGTEPTALWASLQNKGTAWCTKGFATAESQLNGGDFYVYYTLDKQGNATIPRIAIRMLGQDKISNDVRGVLDSQQNIEGNMIPILEEKLKDFGSEADAWNKKTADMKRLTTIEKKIKQNQQLTKEELIFLYEIDKKIEGFGYQRDPRIQELRSQRNPQEDAPIVLDCQATEIAWKQDEIKENTKAYIGPLFPGIFQTNIEHIYSSFPEGKIGQENIEIGGKTAEQLIKELEQSKINISKYAKDMLQSPDFVSSKKPEALTLTRLTVADLGFTRYTTTDKIYEKAQALGLELCPAEVGPHYRLQYQDQPMNELLYVGMKQIADSDGGPRVFRLARSAGGLWLVGDWAGPGSRWYPGSEFVFRLRKSES